MRLGLIGLGRIGAFHARTLTKLPIVESLVVTDAVPTVTAEVADRLGAQACDSPQQLLAAGVDGVLIAAATDAHPTLIRAAVDAGLPVFCEKPVARSTEEAVGVQRYVEAAGLPVQIGYPRRFDSAFQAARDAVASGELGWLHTVRSTTLDPATPAGGVRSRVRRDLSRPQRARLRRHSLGDRQRRGGGLRNGQQQGRRLLCRRR